METLIQFANELAEKSGKIILEHFSQNPEVKIKADQSPVTVADEKAEALMREMITARFPNHGIIGEELGKENQSAEYVWVLDPIDGTKSFICGVPLFGTLISLLKNQKPVLGVIHLPALNEIVIGAEGRNTTVNGKPVKVRNVEKLSDSILVCTDHLDAERYHNPDSFSNLVKSVKIYRNWGDCYMYTLLVKGKVDIVIDPVMNYWDIQALIPVVKGAGGTITDYYGRSPESANSIIAASGKLHEKVLQCLHHEKKV